MEQQFKQQRVSVRLAQAAGLAIALGAPLWASGVQAQSGKPATAPAPTWQHCAKLTDSQEARLSCFDRWAAAQQQGGRQPALRHPRDPSSTVSPDQNCLGLLTHEEPQLRDSVWFGYSQQSYWQLFNGGLSRPFRATDHEPEITYIYPTDAELPGGWRLRYSGIRLVHQSNGQSLPLSRS